MTDDWSGWEEEGGGPDLPSIEDILGGLGDLDEENQRLAEEGFELLNLQLDLEEAGDPFAEDADLLLFAEEDDFAGDDETSWDWRLAEPSDFEGRTAGPFISYNDAMLYAGELPLQWWDIIYDDEDEIWYVYIPESP